MGLTGLILIFILLLTLVFIAVGITLYRRKSGAFNKPTILGISALFLQIVLIILFLSELLVNVNEMIFEIFWWGTVLYGLIIGTIEAKNNVFVSLLTIFISILLGIFMLLVTFITSM